VAVHYKSRLLVVRDLDPDFVLVPVPENVSVGHTRRLSWVLPLLDRVPASRGYGYRVGVWREGLAAMGIASMFGGWFRLRRDVTYRLPVAWFSAEAQLNSYVRARHWEAMAVEALMRDYSLPERPPSTLPRNLGAPVPFSGQTVAQFDKDPHTKSVGRWVDPFVYAYSRAVVGTGLYTSGRLSDQVLQARAACVHARRTRPDWEALSGCSGLSCPTRDNNPYGWRWQVKIKQKARGSWGKREIEDAYGGPHTVNRNVDRWERAATMSAALEA
jgi:hypothetical protein